LIRFFDILFALAGLLILLPVFLVIAILISVDSSGGVFYYQSRVGLLGKPFKLIKFRTMVTQAEQRGGLTIGMRDSRITRIGYHLRKFKLDELPQLINVVIGDMSLVGPRPEISKYVDHYTPDQKIVLTVRPGITDYASIEFIMENDLLAQSENPEKTYIEEIMPAKIALNRRFIENRSVRMYFRILLATLLSLFRR